MHLYEVSNATKMYDRFRLNLLLRVTQHKFFLWLRIMQFESTAESYTTQNFCVAKDHAVGGDNFVGGQDGESTGDVGGFGSLSEVLPAGC